MSDKPKITLAERLDHGLVTLPEVAELGHFSLRKVQKDAENGLLIVEKYGRSRRVVGPVARRYLEGRPMPAHAA